ncbi:Thyrotropin-releasing hormone receptor [Aphelenchoides besseyi]|nr:Thyrotropin-releasing hormone receptor [Aphelenchoides besseyi]
MSIESCPELLSPSVWNHQEQIGRLLRESTACQQLAAVLLSSAAAFPPVSSTMSTTIATPGEDDEFWPIHVRVIMTTIFLLFSFIGVIGNLMVITVVLRVPGMVRNSSRSLISVLQITPTNCYLMSLAASDCLFFIAATPTEINHLHSIEYSFGSVGCAIFSYLPYLAINSSSLSITAFTIERFIGICYPLRARYICTVARAKMIIVIIWIFCLIYNSPWLYLATIQNDHGLLICSFKLDRSSWAYKLLYLNDLATFYLIPMILYVAIYGKITYTLTNCALAKERPNFRKLPLNDEPVKSIDSGRQSFINGGHSNNQNVGVGRVDFRGLLATLSLFVLWMLFISLKIQNNKIDLFNPDWYIFFAKTLIFFNCAINPILYNAMSARFRMAFRRLLRGENKEINRGRRMSQINVIEFVSASQRN